MAISKMKKLSLVAKKEDTDSLINKLTWAGCLEISDMGGAFLADADFSPARREALLAEARESKALFAEARRRLMPYVQPEKGLFSQKATSSASLYDAPADTLSEASLLAHDIIAKTDALEKTLAAYERVLTEREAYQPFALLNLSPTLKQTERTRVFFGSLAARSLDWFAEEMAKDNLGWQITAASQDTARVYLYAVVLKEASEEFLTRALRCGLVRIEFSAERQAVSFAAAIEQLDCEAKTLSKEREDLKRELSALAEGRTLLELAYDLNETRTARLETAERLVEGRFTVMLKGWVPEKAIPKLNSVLSDFVCSYALQDPEEGEDVPVLLDNKKLFRPFESVIEMYSLPQYGSYDPTPIMSVFYFVIFGLMLGDVVYGLLLSAGCLFALKKLDLGKGAKQLISLFGICGISCTLSGILFGGYLGSLPGQLALSGFGVDFTMPGLDLLDSSGIFVFIGISLVVGVLQIFTAMGIKMYMLWKSGDKLAAVFDIGLWYVIFIGIALFALLDGPVGTVVLVGSLFLKVATAGRTKKGIFGKVTGGLLGLYDIVGYASDLASYLRIMALGLSSTVIAYVVNIIATLMISPELSVMTVIGWIFLPIILLGGHLLNIALNLLGCFVHDGRLQYIEFFGRFYEDGGRPFKPLSPVTSYTNIHYDE
ncbi:MAG: V-type ATP synthase subunit I [Clostridia bacterium]|nr:V-type ATP synthase subunit I [Clostridia bacterium]